MFRLSVFAVGPQNTELEATQSPVGRPTVLVWPCPVKRVRWDPTRLPPDSHTQTAKPRALPQTPSDTADWQHLLRFCERVGVAGFSVPLNTPFFDRSHIGLP